MQNFRASQATFYAAIKRAVKHDASFSSWNLNFVAQVDDMRNRGSDKFITWSTAYIRRDESVTRYTILSGCAKRKGGLRAHSARSPSEKRPKDNTCYLGQKR